MKEATGELSMTMITIIAVVAIAAIVTWLSPLIKGYVESAWGKVSNNCPAGTVYNAGTGACE